MRNASNSRFWAQPARVDQVARESRRCGADFAGGLSLRRRASRWLQRHGVAPVAGRTHVSVGTRPDLCLGSEGRPTASRQGVSMRTNRMLGAGALLLALAAGPAAAQCPSYWG